MDDFSKGWWRGKKVFLTGHSGFKGSWLFFWLQRLEASLEGYSLPAADGSIYDSVKKSSEDYFEPADINEVSFLETKLKQFEPEIVIHMAAQPIVQRGYREPIETFNTNVIGSAKLLNACISLKSLKNILIVTSDKCYLNQEKGEAFKEEDVLGGLDPYSSSKAMQEMVTKSYWHSFFKSSNVKIATARAGNVIGGGDVCEDRLVPDYFRARSSNMALKLRNPEATRPWQHVLDPLFGYLCLIKFMDQQSGGYFGSYNFGPELEGVCTVREVANRLNSISHSQVTIETPKENFEPEAQKLALDINKAKADLGWKPVLSLEEALKFCTEFEDAHRSSTPKEKVLAQIKKYEALAMARSS